MRNFACFVVHDVWYVVKLPENAYKTGNLRTYCQLTDRRIFSNVSQWVGFVERVMRIVSMCRLSGGDGWLSRCDGLNFLSDLKIVLPSVCLAKN